MSQIAFRSCLTAVGATLLLGIQSAEAVPLNKFWVSLTGLDSNTCALSSPCRTFAGALAKTTDGGLISCLDSGEFSNSTVITISVTIDCSENRANHWNFQNGDAININAPGKTIILRGIDFTPDYVGGSALGVNIAAAKAVVIDNCVVRGFVRGVYDHRNEAGALIVQNTVIENNAFFSGSGGGITIIPAAGGSIRAMLDRVYVGANSFGIAVDGSNSTAGINVTINDSVTTNNAQDGIVATTSAGGSPISVYVKNTRSANNAIGIRSIGSNVTVRVDGSSVVGNNTGLSFIGGGSLLTFGNNAVRANGSDGAFSGSVALQ